MPMIFTRLPIDSFITTTKRIKIKNIFSYFSFFFKKKKMNKAKQEIWQWIQWIQWAHIPIHLWKSKSKNTFNLWSFFLGIVFAIQKSTWAPLFLSHYENSRTKAKQKMKILFWNTVGWWFRVPWIDSVNIV